MRQIKPILQKFGFGSDVWGFDKFKGGANLRGNMIEDWLAQVKYSKLFGWTQTSEFYKAFDFLKGKIAVSVKSVANFNESGLNEMKKEVRNIVANKGDFNDLRLDVQIKEMKEGTQSLIDKLVEYGKSNGVTVTVSVFKQN